VLKRLEIPSAYGSARTDPTDAEVRSADCVNIDVPGNKSYVFLNISGWKVAYIHELADNP
jgi:hypothetical protein